LEIYIFHQTHMTCIALLTQHGTCIIQQAKTILKCVIWFDYCIGFWIQKCFI